MTNLTFHIQSILPNDTSIFARQLALIRLVCFDHFCFTTENVELYKNVLRIPRMAVYIDNPMADTKSSHFPMLHII